MKRLVIVLVAAVAAGGIAAAPALAGLRGNPSFSQQIPVPAPSQAKQPSFPADDHGGLVSHPEPGDDHGDATQEIEPGDDHSDATEVIEPGDDHGGLVRHPELGDDHGSLRPHSAPSDDHDDRGGSGSRSGRSGS